MPKLEYKVGAFLGQTDAVCGGESVGVQHAVIVRVDERTALRQAVVDDLRLGIAPRLLFREVRFLAYMFKGGSTCCSFFGTYRALRGFHADGGSGRKEYSGSLEEITSLGKIAFILTDAGNTKERALAEALLMGDAYKHHAVKRAAMGAKSNDRSEMTEIEKSCIHEN